MPPKEVTVVEQTGGPPASEGGGVGPLLEEPPKETQELAKTQPEEPLETRGTAGSLESPRDTSGDRSEQTGTGTATRTSFTALTSMDTSARSSLKGALVKQEAEDQQAVLKRLQTADEDMKKMLKVAARSGHQVTKEKFIDHLQEEIKNNTACLEFPFVFLFFFSFAMMMLMHEYIVDTSQVERNYRNFFTGTGFEGIYTSPNWPVSGHKTIDDIDLVDDIWTYLHDAIIPLFINDNKTTAPNEMYRVIRYNQLIGGFQLRQTRRQKKNCATEHPDLGPFNAAGQNPFLKDFDCYPPNSVDTVCFSRPGLPEGIQGFCPNHLTPYSTAGRRLNGMEEPEPWLRSFHRITKEKVGSFVKTFGLNGPWSSGGSGRRLSAPKHAARSRIGVGKSKTLRLDPFDEKVWDNIFVATMFSHEGLTEALRKLLELKDFNWLDEGSGLLEVAAISMNPDLHVYTQCVVSFYLVPDGGIVPYVQTTSFNAEPYKSAMVLGVDVFWFICFLQLSLTFFYRLCKGKGFKKSLVDIYMWFDFGCMCGGIVIMVFWMVYLDLLKDAKDAFVAESVVRPAQFGPSASQTYPEIMDKYTAAVMHVHEKTANLTQWTELFRVGMCWYTLFATMRFFKAFAAQPKLAVVTNTLANCFVDFVHFFIVFWTMFMSYVLAAMFLFGHRIAEFSNTEMAITKCFLLLLGDFDFDELMEENPVTAGLWFYTFCIFMTQIILNMMLAIIMDTYASVQGDAAENDKLWEQVWEVIYEFMVRSKNHITSRTILHALEKLPPDQEYVSAESLREAVPEMTEEQATALIEKVEKHEEADDEASLGMADAMKLIVSIRMNVTDIDKTLQEYVKCEKETRDMLLGKPLMARGGDKSDRPGSTKLHPDSARKIKAVESRLDVIETFLNEAMCYLVFRGKELRNRLQEIEERLSGQRNAAFIANQDLWTNPPTLGGNGSANGSSLPAAMTPQGPAPSDNRFLPIAFSA